MALQLDNARLLSTVSKFPIPPGIRFSYGTAGFRTDASLLDPIAFRTGILASLRSLSTGSAIGIMITASHNPIDDNGVKVADPGGDMLSQDWEPFAEALANASSPESVSQVLSEFMHVYQVKNPSLNPGRVFLARDTRPSGERLLDAARQGVEAVAGVEPLVLGILTTPQLHWMVRAHNQKAGASEQDYYINISKGFRRLLDLKPLEKTLGFSETRFIVDGANGVGASKLSQLQKFIPELKLDIRNSGMEGDGLLNDLVGADFVQKERAFPRNFAYPNDLDQRCASLDGDADRIVFFYAKKPNPGALQSLKLLDGDKILTLFAIFIQQQIQELSGCNKGNVAVDESYSIKFGVVQTAYANGASTRFLKESLGIEVAFTSTGVKHLHHKAAEYDIGIYFEANGHGTILFKKEFLQWLGKQSIDLENDTSMEAAWKATQRLLAVSHVINQAIGDALSVLLLVEAVLQYLGWSIEEWDSVYKDLPSKQLKVKIKDRTFIKTAHAETIVTHPIGLQDAINMEVERVRCGRAFVRPSGTEDIVRVYAEGETQDEADAVAEAVARHVYNHANGGVCPT